MVKRYRHIHFVGIGGAGMSGIAEVLHNMDYLVTGSDAASSETTHHLEGLGIRVFIGHKSEHVQGADVVVRSSAVAPDNPEVITARQQLIPVIPRAEMLAELMRLKYGVAVAGTHGKTTTTSMLATVLAKGGLDPTIVIGGRLGSLGTNAKLGRGDFLVAEADESDGSFLKLSPTLAVVTTIDAEHLDYYSDLTHVQETFLQFINKVPFYGSAILCLDQENIQALLPRVEKRFITYGLRTQADITAREIILQGMGSEFVVVARQEVLGKFRLRVPGVHNVSNALAAVAVGLDLDLELDVIREGLEEFAGVDRRFQIKGEARGILVVDDYGHHPAEIHATLNAAKDGFGRRIVVVFQPHRYTRTKHLLQEFFTAFYQADLLVVTEVYAAGESVIPGVSGKQIADGALGHGHRNVTFIPDTGEVAEFLLPALQAGDMVITLGAGDIWRVGEEVLHRLEEGS
ncbi:MAG: UDP-N-acetylmuramate--L-alanine ligase [candidate division NC10 bacterium]|nr:UDP-N-acetylmuramate--L-alanine ligase [candidate division NC10 bacterium]